jgi:hypothetical protein
MPNENGQYIALALAGCVHCKGLGTSGQGACICVDRSVFRIVLSKFRQCAAGGHLVRPLSIDGTSGPQGRRISYGRKNEEYMADVYLTAKRTLTNPTEWAVFRFFHLLGADWKLCGGRLGMNKGAIFHVVYRVEHKLGKVFRELQPYALWPVDEYFQGNTRRVAVLPFPVQPARLGTPLRPPLAVRPVAPAPVPILDPVKEGIRLAYSQGQTLTAIANDLNSRGILPKRSSRWYPAIVLGVIQRAPRAPAPAKLAA